MFQLTPGPQTLHISFYESQFLSTAIIQPSACIHTRIEQLVLDNEVLLGILFNGTMEINIGVIALFVFYQSTKNLR